MATKFLPGERFNVKVTVRRAGVPSVREWKNVLPAEAEKIVQRFIDYQVDRCVKLVCECQHASHPIVISLEVVNG